MAGGGGGIKAPRRPGPHNRTLPAGREPTMSHMPSTIETYPEMELAMAAAAAATVTAALGMAWRCLIKPKPKPKPKPAAHFVSVYTQANPKYAWSGLATTAAVLDQDVTITARLPDGTIINVRGEPESEIVRGALRIGRSLVGKAVGEARATMEQMLPIVVDKVTVTRATDVEGVPLATDKVFKPWRRRALGLNPHRDRRRRRRAGLHCHRALPGLRRVPPRGPLTRRVPQLPHRRAQHHPQDAGPAGARRRRRWLRRRRLGPHERR